MAAPLVGPPLVLELDRGGAGLLEQPHGRGDLVRAAEAGIGVDDNGDRDGAGQDSRLLDELVPRKEPNVGHT